MASEQDHAVNVQRLFGVLFAFHVFFAFSLLRRHFIVLLCFRCCAVVCRHRRTRKRTHTLTHTHTHVHTCTGVAVAVLLVLTTAVCIWRRQCRPLSNRNVWLYLISTGGLWCMVFRDWIFHDNCLYALFALLCFVVVFLFLVVALWCLLLFCFRLLMIVMKRALNLHVFCVFRIVLSCGVVWCRGYAILSLLADHFFAGVAVLIGFRLWLIDRFERKKLLSSSSFVARLMSPAPPFMIWVRAGWRLAW